LAAHPAALRTYERGLFEALAGHCLFRSSKLQAAPWARNEAAGELIAAFVALQSKASLSAKLRAPLWTSKAFVARDGAQVLPQ
jgi:hypothetical protein